MTDVSPFIFDGPIPPDRVIGREEELDKLLAWAREGRFLGLWAPRRFGKTSLVGKAAQLAGDVGGLTFVVVDLYAVASLADLVIRMEAAYRRWATGGFRRAVASALRETRLGLSLAGAGITVAFTRPGETDPLPALHALLDLPRTIADRQGGRVVVVFDEVQDMLRLDGVEGLVRSHIQHQREVASYVFAGSAPGLLAELFGDRTRPLYGQVEPVHLGPLDDDALADAVVRWFAASGRDPGSGLEPLLALVEGHPQRAMLAAHCLWERTAAGSVAGWREWHAAADDLRARVDLEFAAMWERLPAPQQKVLRAVVAHGGPYKAEARRVLNLAPGSARDASRVLIRGGDLTQTGGGLRFVDPLLGDWVRRRFGTSD